MKSKVFAPVIALALAVCLSGLVATPASAARKPPPPPPPGPVTVEWTGQGSVSDGAGGLVPKTVQCDAASTPYLLFVLGSTKASAATITFPGTAIVATPMEKTQSDKRGWNNFKYVYRPSSSIDVKAVLDSRVSVTHSDAANPGTLTLGAGCLGVADPCSSVGPERLKDLQILDTSSNPPLTWQYPDPAAYDGIIQYQKMPTVLEGKTFQVSASLYTITWVDSATKPDAYDELLFITGDFPGTVDVIEVFYYRAGTYTPVSGACVDLTEDGTGSITGVTRATSNAQGKVVWTGLTYANAVQAASALNPSTGTIVNFAVTSTTNAGSDAEAPGVPLSGSVPALVQSVIAYTKVAAQPNVALTVDMPIGSGGARAILPNGAYGDVTLYAVNSDCVYTSAPTAQVAPCSTVYVNFVSKETIFAPDAVCLDGCGFAGPGYYLGPNLYSAASPATVQIICSQTNCPVIGADTAEDNFAAYPLKVDLHLFDPGSGTTPPSFYYPSTALAGPDAARCWPIGDLTTGSMDPTAGYLVDMPTPEIQPDNTGPVGYCVDVNAITRDPGTGKLTLPVLFVEDPRLSTR